MLSHSRLSSSREIIMTQSLFSNPVVWCLIYSRPFCQFSRTARLSFYGGSVNIICLYMLRPHLDQKLRKFPPPYRGPGVRFGWIKRSFIVQFRTKAQGDCWAVE